MPTAILPALRPLHASDRARVEAMTRATQLFASKEIAVALDVFDASVHTDQGPDPYQTLGAAVDDRLVGWVCWGHTPGTFGTYDLYWIVVDPEAQARGIGSSLLQEMERRLAGHARLVVVETAGRPAYAPTRAFYEARGYHVAARLADYYAPGDDQVIFLKCLRDTVDQ